MPSTANDLEAERRHRNRIVRTAIGMPRPPLRRSRLKARIAAAYGTLRVLEQALRAASSALALGEGDMASCAANVGRDASRYFSGKPESFSGIPGFYPELALCRLSSWPPTMRV